MFPPRGSIVKQICRRSGLCRRLTRQDFPPRDSRERLQAPDSERRGGKWPAGWTHFSFIILHTLRAGRLNYLKPFFQILGTRRNSKLAASSADFQAPDSDTLSFFFSSAVYLITRTNVADFTSVIPGKYCFIHTTLTYYFITLSRMPAG